MINVDFVKNLDTGRTVVHNIGRTIKIEMIEEEGDQVPHRAHHQVTDTGKNTTNSEKKEAEEKDNLLHKAIHQTQARVHLLPEGNSSCNIVAIEDKKRE